MTDPDTLEIKLQTQANKSAQWIRDNEMICAGDKTKLMVISTKQLRDSKLSSINREISLNVCGQHVTESSCEKLLGMYVENDLTWNIYLHGNDKTGSDKIIGLLTKLSQRVGILTRLSKILTQKQFKSISNGIFTSKLLYCLPLFSNIWDKNIEGRFSAFSKGDLNKIQILQNKVLWLMCKKDKYTPVSTLLNKCKEMSVNQLGAFHTLLTVH